MGRRILTPQAAAVLLARTRRVRLVAPGLMDHPLRAVQEAGAVVLRWSSILPALMAVKGGVEVAAAAAAAQVTVRVQQVTAAREGLDTLL